MPDAESWAKSGLKPAEIAEILAAIQSVDGVAEALLFGSRALGTARPGSDVDLAIRCVPGASATGVVRALSTQLNEKTRLPYRFDVVAIEQTTHAELLEHIRRFGRRVR